MSINEKNERLNLNKNAVDFYWRMLDPRMLKILTMMDEADKWAVDNIEEVSKELYEFGRKLGQFKDSEKMKDNYETMITVMTYIHSSRSIRLLNWFDKKFSGVSIQYIMYSKNAPEWEPGRLLLDRLITIKTLSMLSLIFNPVRTRLLMTMLEEDDEDEDEDIDDDDDDNE